MEKVVIKKYENRRLYSTAEKKYVTLDDIERMIVRGKSVQILENDPENEAGKDITSEFLTQILLQKGGFAYFPVEVLEHLIRINDVAVHSLWGQFVGRGFQVFLRMQNDMTKAYDKWFAAFAAKK
jgi:polyhydroxyalkanoate synthesis repressor PhaR